MGVQMPCKHVGSSIPLALGPSFYSVGGAEVEVSGGAVASPASMFSVWASYWV